MSKVNQLEENLLPLEQSPSVFAFSKSEVHREREIKSHDFLQEVTYKVDLTKLYQIKGTCHHHASMDYCPVLVQIQPEILKYHNGANYLLQVWSKDNRKVYEKPLRYEVTVWSINYEYFMFKTEGSDEHSDSFHLVNLEKGNSTILIEDFLQNPEYKYLAYYNNIFYIASQKDIKLFSLEDNYEEGSVNTFSATNDSKVVTVSPSDYKIHGLLVNTNDNGDKFMLVPFETLDNQIDFSSLEIEGNPTNIQNEDGEQDEGFSYSFKQFREVVPRNDRLDPITKFVYAFDQYNDLFAIALRGRSSKVDFYFNGQRVSSINNPAVAITNVEVTFDESYVISGKDIRAIQNDLTNRICIEEAHDKPGYNQHIIFYQKIKNHCKLFSSFVFFKTYMMVAHNHIVSFFSVLNQEWIKHIEFDNSIEQIFRQKNQMDTFDFCILQSDGTINFIYEQSDESCEADNMVVDPLLSFKVEGKILAFDQDREDNNWTLILTQTDNADKESGHNYILNVLHIQKLYTFNDDLFPWLNDKTNFVFMFAPNEKTEMVIQVDDNISLYELVMGDEEPTINFIWKMDNVPDLNGEIHNGIRFKDDRYMFLVDNNNFYKINISTNETRTYTDQQCIGLYFSDNSYLYTLCHKKVGSGEVDRPSGFRLFDIQNLIQKDSDNSYLLTSMQVGCQGLIDFSVTNQRLVYLSSYDAIEVVPVLHRNTISFIGMENRSNYLATKIIDDKFVALDKNNNLRTWDIISGRIRKEKFNISSLNGQDYSNFEIFKHEEEWNDIYKREWYTKILIKSKTPEDESNESANDKKFFDSALTQANIKGQVSYVQSSVKKYYEFKLIEIINEREVKEHLSFIHPYFEDYQVQNIFFSNDNELMYEHLVHQRYYLYKKVADNMYGSNRVSWQLVRRMQGMPTDLQSTIRYPFIFSPDFSMYLDVERKEKQFLIKDSFTQEVRYLIPQWLMEITEKETFNMVAMRFAWVSNDIVKIVNSEGIERLIQINDNFKEIEFNKIPLYRKEWTTKEFRHYYHDPPEPEIDQENNEEPTFNTLERLKRKYQAYKSAQLLDKKSDENVLKSVLNTIDYNFNNTKERFFADLSFTFLHWNLMERLADEKDPLDPSLIDEQQVQRLIYNILPDGNTVLHKLSKYPDTMKAIFEICQPNPENRSDIKFEIPFLLNFKRKSPMDLLNDQKEYKGMDMMLQYLSGYSIDHHSRAIQTTLPSIVQNELPSLADYLHSRLQGTEQTQKIKRGKIQENSTTGITCSPFWLGPANLYSILVNDPSIESEVRLEFLDIANVHSYNGLSDQFFDALAVSKDIEIFNNKGIQKIIEFKWPLTRKYIIRRQFLPFVSFLAFYLAYMNEIYLEREKSDIRRWINYAFMVPLSYLCYYFLMLEKKQLMNEGLDYLKSIWNYLDLIPPILLLIFIPLAITGVFDQRGAPTLEACLQATMSLILWLKFLYFLRIFASTGYLIRIIIEVVVDMRHFLLILLLTFIAFGDAMRSISKANDEEVDENGNFTKQFIGSYIEAIIYIYRMSLGDFDVDAFGEVAVPYAWILFILCTVFNMIIMLNLLIAIISESFARINAVSSQNSYQEKAGLIAENDYLVPKREKVNQHDLYFKIIEIIFIACNRYLIRNERKG